MSRSLNRREFVKKTSVSAGVAISAGMVGRAFGFESSNDRPRIAAIGTGSRWSQRATGLDGPHGSAKEFPKYGDLIAVCDADSDRRDPGGALVGARTLLRG